jgi:hypothetical protein
MMTIFKYAVTANTDNNLWLPKGSKILSIQEQEISCLQCWVMQDISPKEWETRVVLVIGTGLTIPEGDHIIKDSLTYINTNVTKNGFVWHSFERKVW